MRATAESPLDPRACRRVKLLISNYRHTAHLRRTGHETVAHVIYQYRFGKAVKQSPCVLRLPPPAPAPFPGVASPINRTLRFVDSCVYAVGGAFKYAQRRNLGVDTRTQMCICTHCVYAPVPLAYTHPLAGVNAPNTAYKHIRVNAASGA